MSASNLVSQEKLTADRKAYEPSMEEILASIRRIIADDQASPGKNAAPMPEAAMQDDAAVAQLAEVAPVAAHPMAAPPLQYEPAPASPPRPDPFQFEPLRVQTFQAETFQAETLQPEPSRAQPSYVEERLLDRAPAAAPQPASVAKMTGIAVEGRLQSDAMWRSPVEPQTVPVQQRPAEAPAHASFNVAPPLDAGRVFANGSEPRQVRGAPKPEAAPEQKVDGPLVSPATDHAVSAAFNALVASRFLPTDETLAEMAREMIRPMLKTWLDDNLPIMVERLVRAEIERVARGGR